MIIRKQSKRNLRPFVLFFILPALAGIIGNIGIKSQIGNKSVEHAIIDSISNYDSPSELYALEASQYKAEIEKLKLERDQIKASTVSRGEVQRIVETSNEQFSKDKVIKAISNNLKGVFAGKATYIYNINKKYNVNPMLYAAIARHETGNGSSVMCVNQNNPGGISTNSGGFMYYKTLDEGIEAMVRLLKTNYIDKGLNDITSIGNKYCPLWDKRDTGGLNKHWIPMVTKNYIKILEESKEVV